MELLLMNYLEQRRKNSYVDVEINEYTVDGVDCNVKFSHTNVDNMFESVETEETVNVWDVMVHLDHVNNR